MSRTLQLNPYAKVHLSSVAGPLHHLQRYNMVSSLRSVSAEDAAALDEVKRPGDALYFAYGANMNPKVLTGRRKVIPRLSIPCTVPGHYLSFRATGLPYIEPGMATILPRPGEAHSARSAEIAPPPTSRALSRDGDVGEDLGPDVHGVLHVLNERDWRQVQVSEGVGSRSAGYQVIEVNCHLYDGKTVVKAQTLQTHVSMLYPSHTALLPSLRYITLLREGARHHSVDPAFVAYLDSLPAYKAEGLATIVGKWLMIGLAVTIGLPAVPLFLASKHLSSDSAISSDNNRRGPISVSIWRKATIWYLQTFHKVTWVVHDFVLGPLCGPGGHNPHVVYA